MGLETSFDYIDSLNDLWPIGSSDPKSEGDNHLRGLKIVLNATFKKSVSSGGGPWDSGLAVDEATLNNVLAYMNNIEPIGVVKPFAFRPTDMAGEDTQGIWQICDGSELLKVNYEDYFAMSDAAGHPYGGTTTIAKVPDLDERFPFGTNAFASLGTVGGSNTHNILGAQVPPALDHDGTFTSDEDVTTSNSTASWSTYTPTYPNHTHDTTVSFSHTNSAAASDDIPLISEHLPMAYYIKVKNIA